MCSPFELHVKEVNSSYYDVVYSDTKGHKITKRLKAAANQPD